MFGGRVSSSLAHIEAPEALLLSARSTRLDQLPDSFVVNIHSFRLPFTHDLCFNTNRSWNVCLFSDHAKGPPEQAPLSLTSTFRKLVIILQ